MAILHRQRTMRSMCTRMTAAYLRFTQYDTKHPTTIKTKLHNDLVTLQTDMADWNTTIAALVAIPHS